MCRTISIQIFCNDALAIGFSIIFGNGFDNTVTKTMDRLKTQLAGQEAAGLGIREIRERLGIPQRAVTTMRMAKKATKLGLFLCSLIEVPLEVLSNKGARLQFQAHL